METENLPQKKNSPTTLEQANSHDKSESETTLFRLYAIPDYGLSAENAVKSNLPAICNLKNDNQVKLLIGSHLFRYLEIYHPGTELKIVADETTELLFDVRRDWNVKDIIALINFMKRNKPKVSGHKITPTEILESACEYEQERQNQLDIIRQNKKKDFEGLPTMDEVKNILEKKKKEASEILTKKDERTIDEKVNIASGQTMEKKQKWDELKAMNLTEEQFLTEWNNYLKNGK